MDDAHERAVKYYDLTGYDIVDGSTPAMLAALDTAIKAKKPVVVTLWQPHWAFQKYQIRLLDDPAQSFGGIDTYHVVATRSSPRTRRSSTSSPRSMTPEQLQSLELDIENAGQGNELQAVKAWIEQNQSVVDKWTQESDPPCILLGLGLREAGAAEACHAPPGDLDARRSLDAVHASAAAEPTDRFDPVMH